MRTRLVMVGMCCALFCACAYKVVHNRHVSPQAVDRLLSEVEKIRGLKATSTLRVSLEGRKKLRGRSESDLHRISFLQGMEDLSQAWTKVGLIPSGTDLASVFTAVGTEAPAGYYDTSDRVLRIVDRQNPRSELLEGAGLVRQRDLMDGEVLAHEMTHALQDMHFDLEHFLAGAPNDDAALARRCLAEGDASLVGYQYSSVFSPNMETWLKFLEDRSAALDVHGAPDFINRRFQMPYLAGARFVVKLHKKGGWKAVNAAYADPPASTEEILHPKKFIEGRDRPVHIVLPDMKPFAGEGFKELWQDSVGELGLKTVLARERPVGLFKQEPTPTQAAEGWDGDRASVLGRGGEWLLTWKMAFDDEKEAREGYGAYLAMMTRYPGFTVIHQSPERTEARTGRVGAFVERRDLMVVVLEGFPVDVQQKAANAVFDQPLGHAFDPPGTTATTDAGIADASFSDEDGGELDGGVDGGSGERG